MKQCYLILFFFLSVLGAQAANYPTPNTGVKWNLSDLVANSNGNVTFDGTAYFVNDTISISQNDTLEILNNATVRFATQSYLYVRGVFIANAPNELLFTAQNTASPFKGVWVELSVGTRIKRLTLEYANSLRLTDCSPIIDSCIFRNNSPLTNFGNSAISLFRSKCIITNCSFLNNQRAAISGGSNIANAPVIINNLFMGNNTLNGNVPQINLGTTGADTAKIFNNQILRASTRSGGIGFLPIGDVRALISGNIIRNNRYGLTFNGGANINTVISYNVVDSNNTENDPNLGGSGIAFLGGTATSHQNSIVTGNIFRFNLWGITIQQRSLPNLGNLNNADTTDDGKNYFINNTNATTPGINLYNNSVDPISAQNNYWGSDEITAIEASIFHQTDNPSLGLVDYSGYLVLPVTLSRFTANIQQKNAVLNWQTSTESNSDFFSIERSFDGQVFETIGRVSAAGNSNGTRNYNFTDFGLSENKVTYYRIRLVDLDNRFKYSAIVSVRLNSAGNITLDQLYPAVLAGGQKLQLRISSAKPTPLSLQVFNAEGKLLSQKSYNLVAGTNNISTAITTGAAGTYYIRLTGEGYSEVKTIIRN